MDERFPHEGNKWCTDPEIAREWRDTLDRLGPDVVYLILSRAERFSSAGSIPVGEHLDMTRGFVEEWLGWQHAQRRREQDAAQRIAFGTARWAMIAAIASAVAAIVTALPIIYIGVTALIAHFWGR